MRNHDAASVSRRDILFSAIGFLGAIKGLRGWQDTTFSADVQVVNVERRVLGQERTASYRFLDQVLREDKDKKTGGSFFEVSKKLPIEQIYSRLEKELRNQYSLGYTPENAGQGFRKISLTVKQKGLIVQARDGYYAGK
jgi:hypothetical protein